MYIIVYIIHDLHIHHRFLIRDITADVNLPNGEYSYWVIGIDVIILIHNDKN